MQPVPRVGLIAAALCLVTTVSARQPRELAVFFDLDRGAHDLHEPPADASVLGRQFVGMRLHELFDGTPAPRLKLHVGNREWTSSFERLDHDSSGFRSWVGTIDGVDRSHVVITERDGVVSGLVNAVGGAFQIRTLRPGVYVVEEVAAQTSRMRDDVLVPEASAAGEMASPREPATDTAGGIDILFLYTPAAAARFGAAQVEAIAARIISETNTAFARSGVAAAFRTVGVVQLPVWTESTSMSNDLRGLSDSYSGIGPRMREQYRADLVQLLEVSADPYVCGIAWILTSPNALDFSSAFSVSDIGYSGCLSQYTSTHEFGHNLGSAHDPANASGGRLYSYSYGYQAPASGFRTVMAYPCSSALCGPIPNFSSPDVPYLGVPSGTATQNNALSLRNIVEYAANWRRTPAPAAPGVPTDLRALTYDGRTQFWWTPASTGGIATNFVLQLGTAAGAANIYNGSIGGVPMISGPLGPGRYYWRVSASNALGASAASAEATLTIDPPAPPQAPSGLYATVTGNSVTLSWGTAVSNPPATNYLLQVGKTTGASDVFNGPVGNRTTITASAPTGVYFWRVIAANAYGNSPASAERQFTAGCTQPPGATRNLTVSRSGRTVSLYWSSPLTGGSPTQYVVEAGAATGLSNVVVFPTRSTATYMSTQAPPGTFYVRVRAENGCGTGAASNEQVVTVP